VNVGEGKTYDGDITKELQIDLSNLNEELAKQPAKFAWWGVVHAVAKDLVDTEEGKLDSEIRKSAEASGEKITETKIKNLINVNEKYRELKNQERIARVIKEAFAQRKDMLISLAANLREEFDTELSIKKEKINNMLKNIRRQANEY